MDGIKKLLKWGLLAAIIVPGIQVSLVYVNRMQIKNIMDGEALDARRQNRTPTAEELEGLIMQRSKSTSANIPEDIQFEIDIPKDLREDNIVITATYVDEVNLFVYKHPWPVTVTSVSEPPVK